MVIKNGHPKTVTKLLQCHYFYNGSRTKTSGIETAAPCRVVKPKRLSCR